MPMMRILSTFLLVAMTLVCGAPARAAERAVGPTPPRVSFIDGEVSFWRTGAEDWVAAHINTALAAGDSLYAPDGANVEVEIGLRAYVRGGSGTEIGIESLETGFLQLEVTSGHVAIDLKRLVEGQVIELDTPHGAFTIERPGYYRADVDARTTFSARRGGFATVVAAGGESADVGDGDVLVLEGEDTATITRDRAAEPDDWDHWNFDRTAQLGERPRSAEYVPPAVAGVDDLDRYGDWRETSSYGHVWVPRGIGAEWSPYSTGRWVWDPYYGWTWVDDAPWGWAPYHYGRWVYADSYWGWCPGPVVAAPVYAPALVAFFGSHGGVSVGVSVGAPLVCWVPLGYGEPVIPWWGPRGFVGRPYWGGWGGRRYVNNTVINNTTIVNVNNINTFRNAGVRNAVVGVDRGQFGRGRVEHVRVADTRGLQVVRGDVGVKPVRESLVPRAERGRRPPDQVQNRRVVTRRAPQDPTPRLREAGIEPQGRGRNVERRVVAPRTGG
jgi:hypothetical protein